MSGHPAATAARRSSTSTKPEELQAQGALLAADHDLEREQFMSDKRPLASDHGESLFRAAKSDPRHRAAGKPSRAHGLAAEHEKPPLPSLPWAVSERAEPHKSDPSGFDVPGNVARPNAKRLPPPVAPRGTTELGHPNMAPPKRKVAGKEGLPMHEEARPVAERRAKAKGSHALSAKLKSELEAQRKHTGYTASLKRKSTASAESRSAKPQHREGPRSTPAERYSETEPLNGLY